ncbi:SulP family inorganic anion transporter [Paenibacillus peoriae]|uniref:SulP family inorganic anion transporter n=1 Tax=Paenibacillus peoriae TaxID=59893 RepID=UPI00026C578F|nr:SulP family inorganic anion transporter [Paenibacillus peoriae]MEC0182981.1 SulP family inorganic anion transporter [Paenibacillus peoriae]
MKWIGRFEGYSAGALRKDLISGSIVAIVAIPLGMAFAIASGVKPEYGLYTTIVAGILVSLLGGSKFQIGGPTGAFIPILLAIVMQYGYENLLIAGLMAGVILILMGVLRLGVLIKFIPKPVTIGFTAGIAVTIFSGQIANFLGLRGVERHETFLPSMGELIRRLPSLNVYSILTACICLAALIWVPKKWPKVPGSLVGLLLSTLAAAWLFPGQVATIGSAYGDIPASLPELHIPTMTWDLIVKLLPPALVIAMLGAIESLLSAVVADGMTGTKHNSNRELVGQGIANLLTPLFGGIPATGAIARTATNIRNGAVSPISGIVHGLVVFLILVLFASYASNIPLASMAPVLMVVAWNMSERKHFAHILKTRTADSIVLVVTFLLTVFTTLTTAVEVGLVLAVVLFVKRMSSTLSVNKVLPDPSMKHEKVGAHMVTEQHDCPQVAIYNVEGPLFFGAASVLESSGMGGRADHQQGILLLRMGKVPFMDMTGEANFTALIQKYRQFGGTVLVSGLQTQPQALLQKTGCYDMIGQDHFFEHTGEAITAAIALVNQNQCLGCRQMAFRECATLCGKSQERQGGAGLHKPAAQSKSSFPDTAVPVSISVNSGR